MAKRGKSDQNRNITELKEGYSGRTPGWCVRFKVQGVPSVQVNFSNLKYGGSKPAHIAAQRFRDAIEREIEIQVSNPSASFGQMTKRNKTGIVGVCRVDREYIDRRWGTKCHKLVWEAHWPDKDRAGRQKIGGVTFVLYF